MLSDAAATFDTSGSVVAPVDSRRIAGVAAAVLIPRTEEGKLALQSFERQIDFLLERGIRTFAVNGATGEYVMTTADEFFTLLRAVRRRGGPNCKVIAGVGSPSFTATSQLCRLAEEQLCDGLLLPMPYFFPYTQDDLKEYIRRLASPLQTPCYLYNLPAFTTPLEPETALELISKVTSIVGVKDSSGSLQTVQLLRNHWPEAVCILGNDGALCDALSAGACDGVVSGVAGVLPELMLALYEAWSHDPRSEDAVGLKRALDSVIAWLTRFPVPWGLKILAEARGMGTAYFSTPLSAQKVVLRTEFKDWFDSERAALMAARD